MQRMSKAGTSSSSAKKHTIPGQKTKTQKLVEILLTDPNVIKEWSKFSDLLDCPVHEKLMWERGILNGTSTYYELFSKMLISWTSRNSDKTARDLAKLLKNFFVEAAGNLKDNLGEEYHNVIKKEENVTYRRKIYSETKAPPANKFLNSRTEIKWPLTHGLLVPAANFSGRKKQIKTLISEFNANANLILISGFGGIGKTELCKKFANDILQISSSISRIWLNGETEETLRYAVMQLAKELGVRNAADPSPSEYFEYLASMILENCTRLLVVIDNMDDKYPEVSKIIKSAQKTKFAGRMLVIVTSRSNLALDNAGITIQLDVLTKQETRLLLHKSIPDLSDFDADNLAKLVQYFPLALQQAVAFIKQQRNNFRLRDYSVSDYIEEFELKKTTMLGKTLNQFEHEYFMTTLVTWDITISKMSEGANEILKIIAYLNPDSVRLDFLENIYKQTDFQNFDDSMNMVFNYSLVKIEKEVVSIHRLVQEVIRGKVKDCEFPKILFDNVLLACGKFERLDVVGPTGPEQNHLKRVYKFAWGKEIGLLFFNFSGSLFLLLEHDRAVCSFKYIKLHFPLLKITSDLRESEKAREFLEKVFLWSLVNDDDSVTSEIIDTGTYNADKDFFDLHPDDLKLFETGFKMCRAYFGTSSITFGYANKIVDMLCLFDEFDKAISLCEEFISFPFQTNDNQEKVYFFQMIENIVKRLYSSIIDERFCSSQIERIDQIIVNFYQTNPIAEMLELRAKVLDLKGDYERAIALFAKIIPHYEEVGNHSKVVECKAAVIILKIKQLDSSNKTKDEIEKELTAVDCDYTSFSLRGLETILQIYVQNLGNDHPLSVRVKTLMARNMLMHHTVQCSTLCEQVLRSPVEQQYKTVFHYLRGVNEKPKEILESILLEKQLKLGKSHSNTLSIMELIAKIDEEGGKLQNALSLYEQVKESSLKCERDEKTLKDSRFNVTRVKLRIGDFSWLKLKTAADIYKELEEFEDYTSLWLNELTRVVTFYKSVLGESDKLTLRAKNAMGQELSSGGTYSELNESLDLIQQVIRSSEEEREVQVAYFTLERIAKGFYHEKDYEKSRKLLEQVFQFRIRSQGVNHKDTLETEKILAKVLEKLV